MSDAQFPIRTADTARVEVQIACAALPRRTPAGQSTVMSARLRSPVLVRSDDAVSRLGASSADMGGVCMVVRRRLSDVGAGLQSGQVSAGYMAGKRTPK